MLEFFAAIGILAIVFVSWLSGAVLRKVIQIEQEKDNQEAASHQVRVCIKLEAADALILAYDSEKNQFLAQGTSLTEVLANLSLRFPDQKFLINEEEFNQFGGTLN